ncbi:BTB/POZ and MATH domain-containing protein 1 [Brachypodium distachyon]|uniref:BTB/POZ and MATH domain-containing protein 1 n=1 Tax=Brachypodium distachyon TaxID=15368 RepID=UPI00052FF9B0|nr:BTB/POZ and MATH domain-containing protein 1 [Brachypodium distachyon]|eukprot:XP_010239075.1 BTB/POZ and MATH domain-containing protein 1 [Brachypodium distachyon]
MSSSSASSITGKALTGSHVLKIDGYSRTTGIGTGNCVKSRPFTAGGHKWCLEYYPDGYNSTYGSNWISIPSPSGRGWPSQSAFIKNEDLLKSAYLKDDSFSIRCDITVVTEIVAEDVVVATAPAVGLGVKKEARGV